MVVTLKLHGKSLVFVGDACRTDGALATEHQYRHGLRSYAHLYPDGSIMRLGQQIGVREDIQWGTPVTIKPTPEAMLALCFGADFIGVDDTIDIA